MEIEVCRAIATGLADPTIGIAAQLAAYTLDTIGDPKPATPTIYRFPDHPWVNRRKINLEEAENGTISLPAVAVYCEAAPQYDGEVQTVYRDGDFPVAISWLSHEPDERIRLIGAGIMNRCVLRFLTQFNSNTYKDTLRFRNGVALYVAKTPIVQYTPLDQWEAAYCAAQTVITYRVREHSP